MSGAVSRVISALARQGCNPKASANGWSARCPAHDDRNPSLSVGEGDGGRALVHCHAGCSHEQVLQPLGLMERDLFEESPIPSGVTTRPKKAKPAKASGTWQAAVPAGLGEPSMHSEYQDASGNVVGVVGRWDASDGSKTFRPFTLTDEGWVCGGMQEPRPLYQLPAVIASGDVVLVVEGEKCVDALTSLRIVATTSSGGALAAAKSDWSALVGKRVVILPDNDEAGSKYAAEVARLAYAAGAAGVFAVRLSDYWAECPEAGDVADWIEAFGDAAEPATIRGELEKIVAAAKPVQPGDHDAAINPRSSGGVEHAVSGNGLASQSKGQPAESSAQRDAETTAFGSALRWVLYADKGFDRPQRIQHIKESVWACRQADCSAAGLPADRAAVDEAVDWVVKYRQAIEARGGQLPIVETDEQLSAAVADFRQWKNGESAGAPAVEGLGLTGLERRYYSEDEVEEWFPGEWRMQTVESDPPEVRLLVPAWRQTPCGGTVVLSMADFMSPPRVAERVFEATHRVMLAAIPTEWYRVWNGWATKGKDADGRPQKKRKISGLRAKLVEISERVAVGESSKRYSELAAALLAALSRAVPLEDKESQDPDEGGRPTWVSPESLWFRWTRIWEDIQRAQKVDGREKADLKRRLCKAAGADDFLHDRFTFAGRRLSYVVFDRSWLDALQGLADGSDGVTEI